MATAKYLYRKRLNNLFAKKIEVFRLAVIKIKGGKRRAAGKVYTLDELFGPLYQIKKSYLPFAK